jgi:hypothetical protein
MPLIKNFSSLIRMLEIPYTVDKVHILGQT